MKLSERLGWCELPEKVETRGELYQLINSLQIHQVNFIREDAENLLRREKQRREMIEALFSCLDDVRKDNDCDLTLDSYHKSRDILESTTGLPWADLMELTL